MTSQEFCSSQNIILPAEYCAFLDRVNQPSVLLYSEDQDVSSATTPIDSARDWNMFTLADSEHTRSLLRIVRMSKVGQALQYKQLDLFAILAKEFNTTPDFAAGPNQTWISYERIAQAIVIGTGNGDLLYLDPTDGFSLWAFYHDGGDVDKLAPSFAYFLARSGTHSDKHLARPSHNFT